jgi:predicted N-acetyltransferase YhbS
MEIVFKRTLDEKSWTHLTGWSESVFPEEGKGMEWAALGWHVLGVEEGQPVAHVGFDRFTINDSGANISVVGVGGVVVRPEFQRKGIPTLLFRKLHEDCPEAVQADTFTLFCPERLVAYYRRHGYEKVERKVEILQYGNSITTTFTFMARGSGVQKQGGKIVLSGPPW